MTDLETNIILIINGNQEEGKPPTRQEIKDAIGAQVDRAIQRLMQNGLVEIVQPSPGYRLITHRFRLADKVPAGMTFVHKSYDT